MLLKLTWKEFAEAALANLHNRDFPVIIDIEKIRPVKNSGYEGEISVAEIPDYVYVEVS